MRQNLKTRFMEWDTFFGSGEKGGCLVFLHVARIKLHVGKSTNCVM